MDSQLLTLSSQLRGRRRGGFALLIVVTLLAFIVLLLVGLAAYTRVETSIAGNTQRQAQARENALLALNVALSQLQKHAGPDKRVTATAEAFSPRTGTTRYTGVWSSDPADDPDGDPTTPLTWLVSGNEAFDAEGNPLPLAVTPTSIVTTLNGVAMVGTNTSRTANDVLARLVPITGNGVPGAAVGTTPLVGRYAWWVGDQGVKAPVAIADTTGAITYPPYDTADARARLRQQITLGAGASDAAGTPVFEPHDANNAPLVAGAKVASNPQMAFLRNAANAQLGLIRAQQNFHAWSPNNFAVLADTKNGGLRQDLSLAPSLLGSAFAAWANYPAYMEPLVTAVVDSASEGTTPAIEFPIVPAYGAEPLRRRYKITPPLTDGGVIHSVAPVLSFFGLSFSVRENESNAPQMEVAARCVVTLWNPYTSALVPESLRIEVTGLPRIQVHYSAGGNHSLDLQQAMTGSSNQPLRFELPWNIAESDIDKHSWLPGRVYSWSAKENFSEPADGNTMISHYPAAVPPGAGQGIVRQTPFRHGLNVPPETNPITRHCHFDGSTEVQVRVLRASDGEVLATYLFRVEDFGPTSSLPVDNKFVDFAIIRRLPETDELPTGASEKWLSAIGRDPRRSDFPSGGFVGGVNGEDPALYGGDNIIGFAVRSPARLLDRGGGEVSYNQDVPVFELPRTPLLSLGQLQHLQLAEARPFSPGNPWGAPTLIGGMRTGELFDRFFFSGLVEGITPGTDSTGSLILPSPLLRPLRKPDGTKVSLADVRALATPPVTTDAEGNVVATSQASASSSKYFLQGGAFNLNSLQPMAWASVLRGVRFPAPKSFSYLDAGTATGTAEDSATASIQSGDAQFFRFAHSAQETFRAEAGAASENETEPSLANTHLFRQGMRTLTPAQVAALAAKITELIRTKHSAADGNGGPFRSLDEFLSPHALFAGTDADGNALAPRSLLEAAIADAGINSMIAEFSSQWLTQADIMTALAPVLFPRSDTFVIRAYGEAVNPATNAAEGRAWCEALVQRIPDYMDANTATGDAAEVLPANLVNPLNQQLGRRFKVVSFRWLTRSDI
ncbi:MAG: hypothetical protein JNK23_23705 [Opitutaceae bacterium]|nr:hypothetical protein [Opitutaceae bacterium]